jgi:polyphosphate kinase
MSITKKYINRELSWLRFNARVLAESANPDNPPMERARFMSIVSSNLDEFFMVRVGKLERMVDQGELIPDPAGLTPIEQLSAIRKAVRKLVAQQYEEMARRLLPALRQGGFTLLTSSLLTQAQKNWLSNYFDTQIMPVLTPRMLRRNQPFPLLAAKRLYIAVLLQSDKGGAPQLSLVPIPSVLKRVLLLPMGDGIARGILLEDVVGMFLGRLFPHMTILAHTTLRITRNTDFVFDPDSSESLIEEMRKNIKRRSYGKIVRLEVPRKCPGPLLQRLMKMMELPRNVLYRLDGPLDLTFLMKQVASLPGFDSQRYQPFTPHVDERLMVKESIFRTIRGGDLFFYHPYDSFDPILRFVREAADDPNVLAIKQTLYRISSRSPLIPSLARAAQKGKQVTVLIEVRARFDEENNINWCRLLEKAGCHVIYGVPQWKTHSKITLVVRKEPDGLRQYVHLGTGNYNDSTAKAYTDMGILTCDRQIGADAGAFFNIVTSQQYTYPLKELIVSPYAMRRELILRVRREADAARRGLPSAIAVKVNSLSDPEMIHEVYEAAAAGVPVTMLVRGICCARIPANDNLRIYSIVGRFLEHPRIFNFYNGGDWQTYIASADWMPRNLSRRIELMNPVKDPAIAERIRRIFALELSDNRKRWQLHRNDVYRRVDASGEALNAQETLIRREIPEHIDINKVFRVSSDMDSADYPPRLTIEQGEIL